jgi:hypothetical protein
MKELYAIMETLTSPAPNKGQGTTALKKVRPDLNLEKWSIWQPAKSKLSPRERVFRREIELDNGEKITQEVELGYTNKGSLTTEDQKTFYALIDLWEQKGRPTEQTFYSMRKLAKVLQKRWGTNVIDATSQSLMRLRITPIIWKNSYRNGAEKETIEVLDPFNILCDLKIIRRKENGHITQEFGYFKFNDHMLHNMLNNYTKPVMLEVVLSFKSEIAQLLYTHLDLMLSSRKKYERRTSELFDDLGLEGKAYRNASNRVQKLKPALQELIGVRLSTGFIASAKLEKTVDGKDYKIVVTKSPQQLLAFVAEDNDQAVQATPPAQPTSHLADQARELVDYFYRVFHGTTQMFSSSKAINQAISLIARHGDELARFIVDFAHREAGKTKYQPQTFGGILQYAPRAVDEYTNENARRKAQATIATCTLCDRNGYATFNNEQGSGVMIECPHDLEKIHYLETTRNYRYVPVSV